MSESQALLHIFGQEVVPLLIELALIAGIVGAGCCYALFELLDLLADVTANKTRLGRWLSAQAKKRAAAREGDGARLARETRDSDTA